MLHDGSEPAKLFPRLFQSVTYFSALCVITLWNILLHKCFINSMYIVITFRRQVCLLDIVLSLSNKIKYYSLLLQSAWPNGWVFVYELSGSRFESSCSHPAYLLDCLVCYETMAGKNLAMCWGELSAVIAWLTSKCLWSGWKWSRGVKEIASRFPCCPVNVCERKSRQKKGLVMMVSNIFRPLYITLTFTHNTRDYNYRYHGR